MLNWHFEASNDKVNWSLLDRRVYLTGLMEEDLMFEQERIELCQKGATSSWGIDYTLYSKIGFDGYRYFRVIQVG